MNVHKFYIFNLGNGAIEPVFLTDEELESIILEDYAIFGTEEEAIEYAKGEGLTE